MFLGNPAFVQDTPQFYHPPSSDSLSRYPAPVLKLTPIASTVQMLHVGCIIASEMIILWGVLQRMVTTFDTSVYDSQTIRS